MENIKNQIKEIVNSIDLSLFPIKFEIRIVSYDDQICLDILMPINYMSSFPITENAMEIGNDMYLEKLMFSLDTPYKIRLIEPYLSYDLEITKILVWARNLIKTMLDHEVDECFNYKNVKIFDPHIFEKQLELLPKNSNKGSNNV